MVAVHASRGASNKEIAAALHITERTVKAHISVMFEKLAVRDRVQLALKLNNVDI
jgi:DNA-binding NarL/FixJ family response regulator